MCSLQKVVLLLLLSADTSLAAGRCYIGRRIIERESFDVDKSYPTIPDPAKFEPDLGLPSLNPTAFLEQNANLEKSYFCYSGICKKTTKRGNVAGRRYDRSDLECVDHNNVGEYAIAKKLSGDCFDVKTVPGYASLLQIVKEVCYCEGKECNAVASKNILVALLTVFVAHHFF